MARSSAIAPATLQHPDTSRSQEVNFTQEVAFTVRIATDRHDWGFPPATFWTSNWRNAYIDQWLGPSPFVSGADYTAFNWVKPGTSNGLVVKFVNGYDDSFTFTFR